MIRRAKTKDIDRINSLLQQVLEIHAKGRPDIFISGTKKYRDDELNEMFNDDTRPIFVYCDSNDVVLAYAFCIFEETKDQNNMHDMKTLYIDDLCVDEKCRGKHIASDLYRYVKAYASNNDCYRITLNVWQFNTDARAFYDAMGMKPLKTIMEDVV